MGKLTKEQQNILLRIERARILLSADLTNKVITERDILDLLKEKSDFGLNLRMIYKSKGNFGVKIGLDYKSKVLREIFNCPFLLCDQKQLPLSIKQILPIILKARYDNELDELYCLEEQNLISSDELLERKEMLKYCYYGTSEEGKAILKNNSVKKLKYTKTSKK